MFIDISTERRSMMPEIINIKYHNNPSRKINQSDYFI
jgi:hypothetical protein